MTNHKHLKPLALACLFTGLYIAFASNNPSIDEWFYAASIKHQEQLWQSHHLLFNGFNAVIWQLLQGIGLSISPLKSIQFTNAIGAGLSLFILYVILTQAKVNARQALQAMLFLGLCFGVMRFACSAETYTLPIACSLIATWYFTKPDLQSKQMIWVGFWSSLAILMHQVQIWWTLAFFIHLCIHYRHNQKRLIILGLTLLMVPITYFLCANYLLNCTLKDLLLGDYLNGHAAVNGSLKNLLLTLINVFRSFIQIHGMIWTMIKHYPILSVPATVAISLIVRYGYLCIKQLNRCPKQAAKHWIIIALVLHMLFAFVSDGNAEFMAMIPVLIVLYLHFSYQGFEDFSHTMLIAGLLIWNLLFGVLPNAYLNPQNTEPMVKFIEQHPQASYFLSQKPLIENQLCERHGFKHGFKLLSITAFNDSTQNADAMYTDLGYTISPWSRAALVQPNTAQVFQNNRLLPVDSFSNLYGENYIYQILPRQ